MNLTPLVALALATVGGFFNHETKPVRVSIPTRGVSLPKFKRSKSQRAKARARRAR